MHPAAFASSGFSIAPSADPRITGISSPGNWYFFSSSRTSSSTKSKISASSTMSTLFMNTTRNPTFTCGFFRSYFAFAMGLASDSCVLAGSGARRRLAGDLRHDLFGDRRRDLFVSRKLHRGRRPSLRHRAEVRHVPEHLPEGHVRADDLGGAARL